MDTNSNNKHLYQQIRDDIIARIKDGEISPGDKLGTEKKLSESYNVSRPTIRQALKELEELGLIERLLGKGTFVKSTVIDDQRELKNMITVIIPVLSTVFVADIITGAQKIFDREGYSTELLITNNSIEKEKKYLQKIAEEETAGVILHPTQARYYNPAIINVLESNTPLIMTGRYYEHIECNYVVADNYKGSYQATQYLIDRGHVKIGMVSKKPLIKTSLLNRISGYKNCLSDNDLVINRNMILDNLEYPSSLYSKSKKRDKESLEQRLEKFLRENNDMTAVIALNDTLGAEVVMTAKKMNVKVPEELSVIGFDNIEISSRIEPKLTTVDWSRENIGKTAAEELVKLIEKQKMPPVNKTLSVNLIERESVYNLNTRMEDLA